MKFRPANATAIGAALLAGAAGARAAGDSAPVGRDGVVDGPRATVLAGAALSRTAAQTEVGLARTDPNTPESPFAGVASLFIGGRHLATGAAISNRHVITAAHCFDLDGDGVNEHGTDVAVFFNVAGDVSHVAPPATIESVVFHPRFAGFRNPGLSDDLAIVTLSVPLPDDVPIYPLHRGPVEPGLVVLLVGYGETGDGDTGYLAGSGSFTNRRVGANVADLFFAGASADDMPEVWQFDFDGPGGDGFAGGPSLGDGVEATLGGGDSGGPGFVLVDGRLHLFSVNNYVSGPGPAGAFGSGGGGVVVPTYADWIDSVMGARAEAARPGDSREQLARILGAWGDDDRAADLTGDGVVDTDDLLTILRNWRR